jgi:hypothetical protein
MRRKQIDGEVNRISDESNDHRYFVMTPRIVWAFSRTPYDYTLWTIVKDIAYNNDGVCTMQTDDLAILAMMSKGQAQDSREYLMAVGLLAGKLYREKHYVNPIWHLSIPDLWRPNVEWSTQFASLKARVRFKAEQKEAVKKAWNKYRQVKADRKAKGQWEYDAEIMPIEENIFTNLGLPEPYHKTGSPGEPIQQTEIKKKMGSPGERQRPPGEPDRLPGERLRTPDGRQRAPGETKKNHRMDGEKVDEWMNDPICKFLLELPGYNPSNLQQNRQAIVAQSYSVEALQYLWDDCQDGDNPIGLLLYRVGQGMQSPAFLDVLAERKRQAARNEQTVQTREEIPVTVEVTLPAPDASLEQRGGTGNLSRNQVWQAAKGEIQVQMNKASYKTMVESAQLVSVNGTWIIALPNDYQRDWWENRFKSTIRRILTGITGEVCEPEFVTIERCQDGTH